MNKSNNPLEICILKQRGKSTSSLNRNEKWGIPLYRYYKDYTRI